MAEVSTFNDIFGKFLKLSFSLSVSRATFSGFFFSFA